MDLLMLEKMCKSIYKKERKTIKFIEMYKGVPKKKTYKDKIHYKNKDIYKIC